MQCRRVGNNCIECVVIAEDTFEDVYRRNRPDLTDAEVISAREKVHVGAPVEEQDGLDELKCHERQRRARIIGEYMGNSYSS